MSSDLEGVRRLKMDKWEYNYSYKINSDCDISNLSEGENISIAGRIVFFRDLGKIIFGKLKDFNGIAQFSLTENLLDNYHEIKKVLDIGDIIGISGELYKTKAGEITIQVNQLKTLRKAILPLPDKWKGLQDDDLKIRYRYLDIISDDNTKNIFKIRFNVINTIKKFLMGLGFIEVETPILQPIASGAAANPFITHHDALKMNFYLRIAPELYLKRLLVAGMNKVFEIGKCFRNEGIDPTHLQEFTMLEFYQSYISYDDLMSLAIELIQKIAYSISEDGIINEIDFNNIPKITYIEFLNKYGNVDFNQIDDINYIQKISNENNIDLSNCKSDYAVLDSIYKHCCVKKIISPILVYNYPKSPLAKISEEDSRFSEQFQIILKGQEIIKSCLEMNDPDVQEANFNDQKKMNDNGELDVVRTDYDFIEALKFGMPPAGGLGLGIDRLITILTSTSSIKNVVFFPQMRNL